MISLLVVQRDEASAMRLEAVYHRKQYREIFHCRRVYLFFLPPLRAKAFLTEKVVRRTSPHAVYRLSQVGATRARHMLAAWFPAPPPASGHTMCWDLPNCV